MPFHLLRQTRAGKEGKRDREGWGKRERVCVFCLLVPDTEPLHRLCWQVPLSASRVIRRMAKGERTLMGNIHIGPKFSQVSAQAYLYMHTYIHT